MESGGTVVAASALTAGSAPWRRDDLPIRDHRDQRVAAREGQHRRAQPFDRKQGADHPDRLPLCLIFGPYRHGESDHPRVGSGQGIRDARFPELERPIDGIGECGM